jgi:hypothetical protein
MPVADLGFDTHRISHRAQAGQFLGNGDVQRIDQLGERFAAECASVFCFARIRTFDCGATSRPVSSQPTFEEVMDGRPVVAGWEASPLRSAHRFESPDISIGRYRHHDLDVNLPSGAIPCAGEVNHISRTC